MNFVVVTLFYQTAIDHVYFYEINLRNLLYLIQYINNFKKERLHQLVIIITLGIFLVVNIVIVSTAEIMSPVVPLTATQLYLYEIASEKAGREIINGRHRTWRNLVAGNTRNIRSQRPGMARSSIIFTARNTAWRSA